MNDNIILKYKYKELDPKCIYSICIYQEPDKLIKLSFRGISLDCKDVNGVTPIMIAAYTGNIRTTNILLSKNANINNQDIINGDYPLTYALINNNIDIVNILFKNTNKNLLNKENQILLYYLINYSDFELFTSSISNYNINHKDINDNNILEFAVKEDTNVERINFIIDYIYNNNNINLLEKLLFYLISCEEIDNNTFNAISFNETYYFDIFKYIIIKILNIYDFKSVDKNGNNLLLLSVINNKECIFIYLLDCILKIKDNNIIKIKDIFYHKNNSNKNIYILFNELNLPWEYLINCKIKF